MAANEGGHERDARDEVAFPYRARGPLREAGSSGQALEDRGTMAVFARPTGSNLLLLYCAAMLSCAHEDSLPSFAGAVTDAHPTLACHH